MMSILKAPKVRRNSEKSQEKLSTFKNDLEMTMPFWPKNVFDIIKIEENKLFLRSI